MAELQPKHWLGQNFLHDDKAAERFASYLPRCNKCLEIGPGIGILTKQLAKRCKKVKAVEIDPNLKEQLEKILKSYKLKNVEIKIGDALLEDFSKFDSVVGALPYNLATQIIEQFMQSKCSLALFIVQKEVAERLIAKPGSSDYSRLSIMIQNGAGAEIMEILPPSFFWPQPKVNSAVVRIGKKDKKLKIDDELIRVLFQHKNQNIRKALKHSGEKWKKIAEKIPSEIGMRRPRELNLQELAELSKLI